MTFVSVTAVDKARVAHRIAQRFDGKALSVMELNRLHNTQWIAAATVGLTLSGILSGRREPPAGIF